MHREKSVLQCPLYKPETSRAALKWNGKIVDYVEWIYGLHELLNHFGDKTTLKKLFEVLNPLFGVEVASFSLYFTSIKNRKKGDRTTLLDLEKSLIISRMEEADGKPARR